MKRFSLLLAILLASSVVGIAILLHEWATLPAIAARTKLSDVVEESRKAYPASELSKWADVITKARSCLLTPDDAILNVIDETAPRPTAFSEYALAFRAAIDTQRQIEEFNLKRQKAHFDRPVQIFKALDKHGLILDVLNSPDVTYFLTNDTDERFSKPAKEFLENLRPPFSDFIVRRAAVSAIAQGADGYFRANKFQQCIDLCTAALKQLADTTLHTEQVAIEGLLCQAQEELDWEAASNPRLSDKDSVDALALYISKYQKPAFASCAHHIESAKAKHHWKQLLLSFPPPIVALLKEPSSKIAPDQLAATELDSPVRALHDFCVAHPSATADRLVARQVATRLLRHIFGSTNTLIPDATVKDMVRIIIRRNSTKHIGLLVPEDTDEHFLVMCNPNNGRTLRFFQAALEGPPQYVDDYRTERAYADAYNSVDELLQRYDWNPAPLRAFIGICESTGLEHLRHERALLIRSLMELVTACPTFHIADPS